MNTEHEKINAAINAAGMDVEDFNRGAEKEMRDYHRVQLEIAHMEDSRGDCTKTEKTFADLLRSLKTP